MMTLSDTTDENLMLTASRGDEAAFALLVRRWEQPIKRFVYRMLPKGAEAEDLAQEVFVRVYKNKERYREGAKVSTWLYTIAHNLAKNKIRSFMRWGWRQTQAEAGDWENFSLESETPQDLIKRKEERQRVKNALAKLNDDDRALVVMFYYEQFATQDIGEVLGVGAKAVEMKLYRVRKKLGEILKISEG